MPVFSTMSVIKEVLPFVRVEVCRFNGGCWRVARPARVSGQGARACQRCTRWVIWVGLKREGRLWVWRRERRASWWWASTVL